MAELALSKADLCHESNHGVVLIPGQFNMTAANGICKKLQGRTSVVKSKETQDTVLNLYHKSNLCLKPGKKKYFLIFF